MEDFHLIEKLQQFDREKTPERIVHARGITAKGTFEVSNLEITAKHHSHSGLHVILQLGSAH